MSTRDRARDRGSRNGVRLRRALASELRETRLMAGLSQRHVARVCGLSQTMVSRTEQALRPSLTIDEAARLCATLGLRLHLRAYPDGSPVRDAAQLRLLAQLRDAIHPDWVWRTEVPIPTEGDLRAWDVTLDGPTRIGIDAETRLHDVQALQRRLELKLRDSDRSVALLVVAGTHHNRRVIREHHAALASTLPLGTAAIMQALRNGTGLDRGGIAVL